jgi:hypothetical protein
MTRPLNPHATKDPGTGAYGTYDGRPIHQGPVTPPRMHVTHLGTPYHVYQNPDGSWGAQYAGEHPDADPGSWNHSSRQQVESFLNHFDPAFAGSLTTGPTGTYMPKGVHG